MVGFIGPSGRHFTDSQRRAMFMSGDCGPRSSCVAVANVPKYKQDNQFAIGASLATAGLATKAVGAAGSGIGSSVAGAGFGTAAGVASVGLPSVGGAPKKSTSGNGHKSSVVKAAGGAAASAIAQPASAFISSGANEFIGSLGEPHVLTNSEMIDNPTTQFGGPAYFSNEPNGADIDIEKVRWALKKQYPGADVDTKVTMLSPDKYMETALKENPGREDDAIRSNGFYSPRDDKTYLEIDTDGLNTVRAMIHEFVHDMSDDGVGDDMLNEGYADYVAYRVMVDELNIPESRARVTLGYPEEEYKIEKLVSSNGRKKVDEAFLKSHSMDGLV